VGRYEQRSDYPRLIERLRELQGRKWTARRIADQLHADGFRPPRQAKRYTAPMVCRLLARIGLPRSPQYGSIAVLGADEYRPTGLARRLGMSPDRLRRWLRSGWLVTRPDEYGHSIIWADRGELRRLRRRGQLLDGGGPDGQIAKLKTPSHRPKR
jgi:hypothetical protein